MEQRVRTFERLERKQRRRITYATNYVFEADKTAKFIIMRNEGWSSREKGPREKSR